MKPPKPIKVTQRPNYAQVNGTWQVVPGVIEEVTDNGNKYNWGQQVQHRLIANDPRDLTIEYKSHYDNGFSVVIVDGPAEVMNIHTLVDGSVLNEALMLGTNVVPGLFPLRITGRFTWKLKGHYKLCKV